MSFSHQKRTRARKSFRHFSPVRTDGVGWVLENANVRTLDFCSLRTYPGEVGGVEGVVLKMDQDCERFNWTLPTRWGGTSYTLLIGISLEEIIAKISREMYRKTRFDDRKRLQQLSERELIGIRSYRQFLIFFKSNSSFLWFRLVQNLTPFPHKKPIFGKR